MKGRIAGKATGVIVLVVVMFLGGGAVFAQEEAVDPSEVFVTNVFFDTFIVDALSDLSLDSGIPILADSTVSGFVTVELFDVPLPLALEQLLLPGGYTFKWMDGYFLVGSAQKDSPLFHMLSVTERVKLKHIRA